MTQIGADGFLIVHLRKSAKSADKVPSLATLAKRLYSGFCLTKNRQKTVFLASLGQAHGFGAPQNHGKHNIWCLLQGQFHKILHFNCLRIMDLGVVKWGCFLI
jgi:hypothetical protein